jgi:HAD superfamily hydrolase (TIGR01509 family)
MSLEALIFDFDGTLADTEETHRQAFNAAFLRYDLQWEWPAPLYRELLQTSGGKERIGRFIDTLRVPLKEKERLGQLAPAIHRTKTQLYTELIGDGRCPLRPGVRRLLAEAQAAGVQLAIASTTAAPSVAALLSRHLGGSALRQFHTIVCGEHVRRKKPAPDIYELALATLGRAADECVAFEDSVNGLRAAKATGLFTVVTPSQWTVGGDFVEADLELPHLGDPEYPLPQAQTAALSGPWLGLEQLASLHGKANHAAAH